MEERNVPKSIVEVTDTPTARKADYILKVDGDSMMPKFNNGDRVFVKAQETVNMNEGDRLHSLNPEFDDIAFNEEQNIKCVGKVLGKI